MSSSAPAIRTSIGDIVLHEYRLALGTRTWSFLHGGAVVTRQDEQRFLSAGDATPYGVMLWPASIALAHDVDARGSLAGQRVLELGAGTGVPGIVAAGAGARVLQIDRSEVALHAAALNASRNRVEVERRIVDWDAFETEERFDLVIGADVLYVTPMHARLAAICETVLAPGGRVLFADPFREQSLPALEAMSARGWQVSFAKWSIEVESGARPIAVYDLTR